MTMPQACRRAAASLIVALVNGQLMWRRAVAVAASRSATAGRPLCLEWWARPAFWVPREGLGEWPGAALGALPSAATFSAPAVSSLTSTSFAWRTGSSTHSRLYDP
ncbi:hypothetical protein C8Q72DRAFT_485423 [Fomitopsis betulina]|nr:hypothetical protein C8Q72DRAFT_485423 [Fomitopsis betulina]